MLVDSTDPICAYDERLIFSMVFVGHHDPSSSSNQGARWLRFGASIAHVSDARETAVVFGIRACLEAATAHLPSLLAVGHDEQARIARFN